MAAMPPHILPAGAELDATGAGVDELGGGPELTTPDGVSTGKGLVVAVAGAVGACEGAGASAGGLGCDEQLSSTVGNRNATHASVRFDSPMRLL